MSLKEIKLIINEFDLLEEKETYKLVEKALKKFGSAYNILLEALKPEFKYLKKTTKLLALLNEKQSLELTAEKIHNLMYTIYKNVAEDSQRMGEDFEKLMKTISIHKSIKPSNSSDMDIWIIEYIGGKKLIAKITLQEPNQLKRRIINAIEKYQRLPELSNELAIENKTIQNILFIKSKEIRC